MEKSIKPNGYAVRSWGDVIAVATLMAMLLSVVAWGLKLEDELNHERDRRVRLEAAIAVGILPRADERLRQIEETMVEVKADVKSLEKLHQLQPDAARR